MDQSLDGNRPIHYGNTDVGLMMKRACLVSLLIVWVMWIRTEGPTADDWTQMSGFISEAQCTSNMKEKLDVWRRFKDAKFAENSVTFTENKTTVSYLCLPDTEDPRKTKAPKKQK
jgi:hypothetical protein